MGWNTANDIVDPQVRLLIKRVENDELGEAVAYELLYTLIKDCQANDWDTEDETLELFTHVPWVVRAFAACDVSLNEPGELPDRSTVARAVRNTIDAMVSDDFHDLSEDYERTRLSTKITDAVAALLNLED